MGNMLVSPIINTQVEYQIDVIQGTWKFRPAGGARPGVTFEDLCSIGHDLQIENRDNPFGGKFINLSIIEASEGEYGLCMTYKMSKNEARLAIDSQSESHFLDRHIHFFQKKAGLAYKGFEGFRSHVVIVRNLERHLLES